MGKRRLEVVWLVAACAVGVVGGGCAQSGAKEEQAAGGAGDGTDALVARGAAGLERMLSGEQRTGAAAPVWRGDGVSGAASAEQGAKGAGSPSVAVVEPKVVATEKAVGAPAGVEGAGVTGAAGAEVGGGAGMRAEVSSAAAGNGSITSGWWGSVGETGVAAGDVAHSAAAPVVAGGQSSVSSFWRPEDSQGGAGSDAGGFRISALALCSRVEGFGKIVKVESVPARGGGRSVPLLVYTQVDGFSYRTRDGSAASAGAEDGKTEWVVELGQSVAVYRAGAEGSGGAKTVGAAASDVLVKVEPEQTARDVALFKRRDHFLVQRIELPAPLVPGKYVVKVTVRDKATGMVDERVAEVVVR